MDWPIQESLYYHLKLMWFKDLGVVGHDEDYFYNPHEFTALNKVLLEPYWEESPQTLRRRLEEQTLCLREQEARIAALEGKLAEREQKLQDIITSLSFRLGRGVTWLPRKIRGGVRRFKRTKPQ